MARIFYSVLLVVAMTICWYGIFAGLGWAVMVTTGYILRVSLYVPFIMGLASGLFYILFTGRTDND